MPYISLSSMASISRTVNNDGWPDIYVADMLPDDEHRLKTTSSFETWNASRPTCGTAFITSLPRNMLHLNNATARSRTSARWPAWPGRTGAGACLLADLDLDGFKDIYVTNGLAKDVTSQDYIAFLANRETMVQATSGGRVDSGGWSMR